MSKIGLSLPPNLVGSFHWMEGGDDGKYFCTCDPVGRKLGSGGGTHWLLRECWKNETQGKTDFYQWLASERRILLHAGGQSRRLPSYAPSGKILTPIPIFRWARGQRISQNLLQLQLPLYERIMEAAPKSLTTLIASGDVLIRTGKLQPVPEADVVCYGLWADASLAKNHGVFVSCRETPEKLDFVLQKPSIERLGKLLNTHLFLMDVGIWLLSDKAMRLLIKRSTRDGEVAEYDLYSDFGCALGEHPTAFDSELSQLSVVVLPLPDGEFYHYGTSCEMISSTVAIQNLIYDQRAIMHFGVKPHPSIFIQNAHVETSLTSDNQNLWIENSWMGKDWQLCRNHIITGLPRNDWQMTLTEGVCVDVVPIDSEQFVLRPYGFEDAFRGSLSNENTLYLGRSVSCWLAERGLSADEIEGNDDLQSARIFPVSNDIAQLGRLLRWMISSDASVSNDELRNLWLSLPRLSANEISDRANLIRLHEQRLRFRAENLSLLAKNHHKSVFYQTNLDDMAREFQKLEVPMPEPLPEYEPLMKRISDQMFRSQLLRLRGQEGSQNEARAFGMLREGLTKQVLAHRQSPRLDVYADQIVWGRSPVRIDIAGGWTDTPPYCLTSGSNVVNLAIELNGQPPLQTYVKTCAEPKIILRSIDLGASEVVETFDELQDFERVGSPFSIPKAALCLAGFLPRFSEAQYDSLRQQLQDFGCGIELTLLSAVPAGSGLGTSSILAATVLGAVSDLCGLAWDKVEICNRTLVLEQLLTTGGGWQDQYGGVLPGVKLLSTMPGFEQTPQVRWLPDTLFTDPQFSSCHLLYYTGITRTAKAILAEIVRSMFLAETEHLTLLDEMRQHAVDLYETIQQGDFQRMACLIGKTWRQNKLLDKGTNPPAVEAIIRQVQDYCYGLKLPGAGGGGFLYMIAKDPDAASRIRRTLTDCPPNQRARFVEMSLSRTGQQISRS